MLQAPDVCVCTGDYHTRGPAPTALCQELCPGDYTRLCGSPGYLRAFATESKYIYVPLSVNLLPSLPASTLGRHLGCDRRYYPIYQTVLHGTTADKNQM